MNKDSILITGASGMLGHYVDFGIPTTRQTLDVTNLSSVRDTVARLAPTVILHLAAATNLVACEKKPTDAYLTNTVGTYNIATAARETGTLLVYVSTSAVFDGKKAEAYDEDDTPSPSTHYGHSKYMGELLVQAMLTEYIIARTCWIFGGGPQKDHKFVANILKQLDKPSIQVIGGKRGSPTYGKDLIEAICALIERNERGVFHLGNSGAPTRVEIAKEIVRIKGSGTMVVETDASAFEAEYPGAGSRGNESITSKKVALRPWHEALREYIEQEWP